MTSMRVCVGSSEMIRVRMNSSADCFWLTTVVELHQRRREENGLNT